MAFTQFMAAALLVGAAAVVSVARADIFLVLDAPLPSSERTTVTFAVDGLPTPHGVMPSDPGCQSLGPPGVRRLPGPTLWVGKMMLRTQRHAIAAHIRCPVGTISGRVLALGSSAPLAGTAQCEIDGVDRRCWVELDDSSSTRTP